MPNINDQIGEINKVLKRTMDAIEEGRQEIFEISEAARNECNRLKEELYKLQSKVKFLIKEVEVLENQESISRKVLLSVSKQFSACTEENIKTAYENANNLRIKLELKRHEERNLIKQRTELELRLKKAQEISKRAENLMAKVGVAFDFLSGDLEDISCTLENINQRNILGKRIIQVQEEERQRIAMDIHDGPAQSLTNAIIKTELCEKLMDIDISNAKVEIKELKAILRDSIKDIRKIIYNLRPAALDDVGLIPTIKRYVNKFQEDTGIETDFVIISQTDVDDNIKKVALFRVVQEALNNIQKHSEATMAKVKMELAIKNIFLVIEDNGVGFNIESIETDNNEEEEGGFGLFNMKERVELLNGNFNIKSELNRGTKIIVNIPNEG